MEIFGTAHLIDSYHAKCNVVPTKYQLHEGTREKECGGDGRHQASLALTIQLSLPLARIEHNYKSLRIYSLAYRILQNVKFIWSSQIVPKFL